MAIQELGYISVGEHNFVLQHTTDDDCVWIKCDAPYGPTIVQCSPGDDYKALAREFLETHTITPDPTVYYNAQGRRAVSCYIVTEKKT